MLLSAALSLASPRGNAGRLSVLIFHRVLPRQDPLFPHEIDAAQFERICTWLRRHFNVLPLAEGCARLKSGDLPARAAAITFDDGYADNHDVALPILLRHGLSSTFFVATEFIDGGTMWNDVLIESIRRTAKQLLDVESATGLPLKALRVETLEDKRRAIGTLISALKYLPFAERRGAVEAVLREASVSVPAGTMMTSAQVRALRDAGMSIGGHTASHPILARLPEAEARREIIEGKAALERMIDAGVTLFAYPNGKPGEDFTDPHVAMVREAGFQAAVTTGWGAANTATDPFRIPRFTPWDRTRARFTLRMLGNLRRK